MHGVGRTRRIDKDRGDADVPVLHLAVNQEVNGLGNLVDAPRDRERVVAPLEVPATDDATGGPMAVARRRWHGAA